MPDLDLEPHEYRRDVSWFMKTMVRVENTLTFIAVILVAIAIKLWFFS